MSVARTGAGPTSGTDPPSANDFIASTEASSLTGRRRPGLTLEPNGPGALSRGARQPRRKRLCAVADAHVGDELIGPIRWRAADKGHRLDLKLAPVQILAAAERD